MSHRTDYDKIAVDYDSDPRRAKEFDADLVEFLERRPEIKDGTLAVLDIGCGTGNQLVANRRAFT